MTTTTQNIAKQCDELDDYLGDSKVLADLLMSSFNSYVMTESVSQADYMILTRLERAEELSAELRKGSVS